MVHKQLDRRTADSTLTPKLKCSHCPTTGNETTDIALLFPHPFPRRALRVAVTPATSVAF